MEIVESSPTHWHLWPEPSSALDRGLGAVARVLNERCAFPGEGCLCGHKKRGWLAIPFHLNLPSWF